MNNEDSNMAANAIIHEARQAFERVGDCMIDASVMYRPALSIDGNKWCALYGDNLQDGVAGFGNSPAEAMADFNKNWYAKLPGNYGQKPVSVNTSPLLETVFGLSPLPAKGF